MSSRKGAGSSSRGNNMAQNFVDRQVDRQIEKHQQDMYSDDDGPQTIGKKSGFAETNSEWARIKTELYQQLTALRDTIAKRKVVQKNEGWRKIWTKFSGKRRDARRNFGFEERF